MEWINVSNEFPTNKQSIFIKYKWTLEDEYYKKEIAFFKAETLYFHNDDDLDPWHISQFEELLWLKE